MTSIAARVPQAGTLKVMSMPPDPHTPSDTESAHSSPNSPDGGPQLVELNSPVIAAGRTETTPSGGRSNWSALAVGLAMVLVAGLGFYVGRATAPSASPSSMTTTPESGSANSAPQDSASASPSPTQASPEFAPSLTDPQGLEIVRAEPRRDGADPRAVGAVDAPVVLVEFSDYSCPVCTMWANEIEPHLQDLIDDGTLRIEYRDFVIFPEHGSDIAAHGGWAAANQGKFIEYRHAVFSAGDTSGHSEYTVDSIVAFAEQAGVGDLDQFRADLESAQTAQQSTEETDHAKAIGLGGTPFFFINDAAVSGAYPPEFIIRTIEEQAKGR